MNVKRWMAAAGAALVACAMAAPTAQARAVRADGARAGDDLSAQTRQPQRRARTRIEVRPLRGPLRRDCVPVFEERWIPQWGGRVLYAGQDCHWTRAPL